MNRFPGVERAASCIVGTLVALQCSCSSMPLTRQNISENAIGVVVGDAPPKVEVQQGPSVERKVGSEALKGVGKGARWCVNPVDPDAGIDLRGVDGQGAMLYFFWLVACEPVGIVVGATLGGAVEAARPDVHLNDDFRRQVQQAATTAQVHLGQALGHYAAANGLSTVRLPSKATVPLASSSTRQSPNQELPVSTLLEVNVVRIASVARSAAILENGFIVEARVRVIALPSQTVLDSYTFVRLPTHAAFGHAKWTPVQNDLSQAYEEIAEAAFDESFLVYRGNTSVSQPGMPSGPSNAAGHAGASPFPEYTLRPITPAAEPSSGDNAEAVSIDLRPVFAWEPLPDTVKRTPAEAAKIQDLTYEFRLYQHGADTPVVRAGLVLPTYSLENELSPCTRYSWTVRAHFTLEGRPRATEWIGLYDRGVLYRDEGSRANRNVSHRGLGIGPEDRVVDPAWYRRNSFPDGVPRLPNAVYYPRFLTRSSHAFESCPDTSGSRNTTAMKR